MKLIFRQRLLSWLDSYDIFDEAGNVVYSVKGQLAFGHRLVIYDAHGREVGMVAEKILTLLPRFEIYKNGRHMGQLKKEFTFFVPRYYLDYNGWRVEGSVLEWDYKMVDARGNLVAFVSKQLLHLTDTYILTVANPEDALEVLMFALAMDAEKCSRKD